MAIDFAKARRLNPRYARSLGWIRKFDQIIHLLDITLSSPGPDQFALAVQTWQRRHPPLVDDGILGENTWRRMEHLTEFSIDHRNAMPLSSPPPAPPPLWLTQPPPADPRPASGNFSDRDLERIAMIERSPLSERRTFAIFLENGRAVILELKNRQVLRGNLTFYPESANKAYYQPGDIVSLAEIDQSQMERLYPRSFPPGETTIGDLALAYLGEPQPTYNVGFQIDAIRPPRPSQGDELHPDNAQIVLRPLLFLKTTRECTIVELDEARIWTGSQLDENFRYGDVARGFTAMLPIIEAVAQIAGLVAGGAAQSSGRYLFRRVALRAALPQIRGQILRRAVAWLLTEAGRNIASATVAFAKAFYIRIARDQRRLETWQRLGVQTETASSLGPAITDGATAFATSLIGDALGGRLQSWMQSNLRQNGPIAGQSLVLNLRQFVRDQLIESLTHRSFSALVRILGTVVAERQSNAVLEEAAFERLIVPEGQTLLLAVWESFRDTAIATLSDPPR